MMSTNERSSSRNHLTSKDVSLSRKQQGTTVEKYISMKQEAQQFRDFPCKRVDKCYPWAQNRKLVEPRLPRFIFYPILFITTPLELNVLIISFPKLILN